MQSKSQHDTEVVPKADVFNALVQKYAFGQLSINNKKLILYHFLIMKFSVILRRD